MIKFLKDDKVLVETKRYGQLEFQVEPIAQGQSMVEYMDYIMNAYWFKVGKNKRRYYEEYE